MTLARPSFENIVGQTAAASGAVWQALDLSGGSIGSPIFTLARSATSVTLDSDAGDAASAPTTANLALYDTPTLLELDLSGYTAPRIEIAAYWSAAASGYGGSILFGLGDNAVATSATKISIAGWVDGTSWLCRRYGQVGSASTAATKTDTDRMVLIHDFDDGSHAEGVRASFQNSGMDSANINTAVENRAWTWSGSMWIYGIFGVYDSTTPPASEEIPIAAFYRVSERLPS